MTLIVPQTSHIEPTIYKSLGLNALLGLMPSDRKYHILDLGPALGINVEFWSQFRCRLTFEDFYRSYRERLADGAGGSKSALFAELLPFDADTRFDVVLAWDLFNYLDADDLQELIQRLTLWCRRGTLLFAMISSLPNIPAEPNIFRILDGERMIYETRTRETRPCPRHQPREIGKFMARFDVSSSYLLRHGVQEYVFSFKEGAPG